MNNCDEKRLESLEKKSYLSDEIKNELNILRQGKVDIEAVSKISPNFLTEIYIPCKVPCLKKY